MCTGCGSGYGATTGRGTGGWWDTINRKDGSNHNKALSDTDATNCKNFNIDKVWQSVADSGVKANQLTTEVANLFVTHIHAREQFNGLSHRRRQGLVPDFLVDSGGRIGRRRRCIGVKGGGPSLAG